MSWKKQCDGPDCRTIEDPNGSSLSRFVHVDSCLPENVGGGWHSAVAGDFCSLGCLLATVQRVAAQYGILHLQRK